jgi:hypothetical protein
MGSSYYLGRELQVMLKNNGSTYLGSAWTKPLECPQ